MNYLSNGAKSVKGSFLTFDIVIGGFLWTTV